MQRWPSEKIVRPSSCIFGSKGAPLNRSRILIILNGICRRKAHFQRHILPQLSLSFNIEVRETTYAGHAEALAREGSREGFNAIISAGGDGTTHQVINGVLNSGLAQLPSVGLIPLGSGNDLARAFGIKANVPQLVSILNSDPKLIDVGLAITNDASGSQQKRYFINECSLGMGPEVVRRVNQSARSAAARWMYLKAIVATFLQLKAEKIEVKSEGFSWSGLSRVLAIANGNCFGHGIYIAPNASPADGQLNVFLAANPGMLKFLRLLQELKRPVESEADCLQYFTTRMVEVISSTALPVEADGELLGFTPLRCEVQAAKIKFLY